MNKQQQLNSDKKVLASLEAEYKRAQRVIYSIRALVTDLNFEELIPDSQERCLMVDELQAYDYIRTNLMNRIRFYRNRIKANKPEPWEEDSTHHCGQDSKEEGHGYRAMVEAQGIHIHDGNIPSEEWGDFKSLVGMQVMGFTKRKCEGCPQDHYGTPCIKLELVGGIYLCLAPLPNSIATE